MPAAAAVKQEGAGILFSLPRGGWLGDCCTDSTLRAGVHHVLQAEPGKWADWVALGTVELADLVDSQLTEIADWELNLKMLKVQLISPALEGVRLQMPT